MQTIDILKNVKTIHFIGIGGISMSGIAMMLHKLGYNVTGSDIAANDMTKILANDGIDVYIGSNKNYINNADIVVYTAAIPKTDIEYMEAVKINKPLYERAIFIGHMLKIYNKPICIAGMHGKTTTTSMVSNILKFDKKNPTVLVGSKLRELGDLNYVIGSQEYFVLEACEYVDSFLNFAGNTEVILNIEEEHLDYFKSLENINKSFEKFMCLTHFNGNLVLNKQDANISKILNNISKFVTDNNINVLTFAIDDTSANIIATNIVLQQNSCYAFDVLFNHEFFCTIHLNVPGKHNILNALATIGVGIQNDISVSSIVEGLEEFTGASRRFEYKKDLNGAKIYDDYAHHPTEVKAVINTAKEFTKGKVYTIFQPHTYSRLKTLFEDFSKAFNLSDITIITDIYAAREKDDGTISSQMLVDAIIQNGKEAMYIKGFEDIAKYLKENVQSNDTVLLLGAGTIINLSELL